MSKLRLSRLSTLMSLIILVAIAFSVTTLYLNHKAAQEEALIFQLKQLRTGVQISLRLDGKLPPSLEEMIDTPFRVGTKIDWKIARSGSGKLMDPFGNPYNYDSGLGWVSSTTRGYENW